MRFLSFVFTAFLWSFAYCHYANAASPKSPDIVSGITTVTTSLSLTETFSSHCDFSVQTGSINGKEYSAAYEISGETETVIVAGLPFHNRVLTVTWFYEFDEPLDADSFKVRQLGIDISDISGSVNLKQGAFKVSYKVTIPLITFLPTAINYCLLEYVAFDFHKVDSVGDHFYYLLYTDNLGSALVDGLRDAVCDLATLTNCPLYQSQLSFDCNAFKQFDKCSGTFQYSSTKDKDVSSTAVSLPSNTASMTSQDTLSGGSTTIASTSTPSMPTVISGITTVTKSIGFTGTLSSECDFKTQTGSINGKKYHAAYAISGETTTSIVAAIPFHNRVLTVSWYFQFDEPLHSDDFKVRQLGKEISSIDGRVNLEQGAFAVSYQVTIPFVTYLTSALNYCLLEYVAFDFHKVDSDGNDFYFLLYTDNLGSALVDGLKNAVCDLVTLTNCPLYQSQLSFDCDAFRKFETCNGATTFSDGSSTTSIVPGSASSSASTSVPRSFSPVPSSISSVSVNLSIVSSSDSIVSSSSSADGYSSSLVYLSTESLSFTSHSGGSLSLGSSSVSGSSSAAKSTITQSSLPVALLSSFEYVSSAISDTTRADMSSSAIPASATPTVVSGITTVGTPVEPTGTLTSECVFQTITGSINGKSYKAAYDITGAIDTKVVAGITFREKVFTITWYFQFDEVLDAESFHVRQLGPDISGIRGTVNLEDGSFKVTYEVILPLISYIPSVINYCLLEYVAFDFHTIDSAGNNFIYLFYTDNLGSALLDGLRATVCDLVTLTNCPLYQAQLPFYCDGLRDFDTCTGAVTFATDSSTSFSSIQHYTSGDSLVHASSSDTFVATRSSSSQASSSSFMSNTGFNSQGSIYSSSVSSSVSIPGTSWLSTSSFDKEGSSSGSSISSDDSSVSTKYGTSSFLTSSSISKASASTFSSFDSFLSSKSSFSLPSFPPPFPSTNISSSVHTTESYPCVTSSQSTGVSGSEALISSIYSSSATGKISPSDVSSSQSFGTFSIPKSDGDSSSLASSVVSSKYTMTSSSSTSSIEESRTGSSSNLSTKESSIFSSGSSSRGNIDSFSSSSVSPTGPLIGSRTGSETSSSTESSIGYPTDSWNDSIRSSIDSSISTVLSTQSYIRPSASISSGLKWSITSGAAIIVSTAAGSSFETKPVYKSTQSGGDSFPISNGDDVKSGSETTKTENGSNISGDGTNDSLTSIVSSESNSKRLISHVKTSSPYTTVTSKNEVAGYVTITNYNGVVETGYVKHFTTTNTEGQLATELTTIFEASSTTAVSASQTKSSGFTNVKSLDGTNGDASGGNESKGGDETTLVSHSIGSSSQSTNTLSVSQYQGLATFVGVERSLFTMIMFVFLLLI